MATKKSTEVANVISEEALSLLRDSYPVEASFTRILLPRLGMLSQDVTKGKGKDLKVVQEAGLFFIDRQSDEEDEDGKKVWKKEELGNTINGIILFQRKQLRFYNSDTEVYTSSPVYDTEDQVLPLFRDKAEVDRGTPAELKSRKEYQGVSAKGKPISKLEDNRILYVLYKDEVFQMNLRGTSMYSFLSYGRKVLPPSVLTCFNSEAKEAGSIKWNQMTFESLRPITNEEAEIVLEKVKDIREGIEQEKAYYSSQNNNAEDKKAEQDLKNF